MKIRGIFGGPLNKDRVYELWFLLGEAGAPMGTCVGWRGRGLLSELKGLGRGYLELQAVWAKLVGRVPELKGTWAEWGPQVVVPQEGPLD